jgi:hypothetical protein
MPLRDNAAGPALIEAVWVTSPIVVTTLYAG